MRGTGVNALRLISLPAVNVPENKMSRRALAAVNTKLGRVAVPGIIFKTDKHCPGDLWFAVFDSD